MTFFNPQAFDFSYILLENYDENIKKCKVLTLALYFSFILQN